MAREQDPNPRFASRCESLNDFIRDVLTILDLGHDSDLHVVHDQRDHKRRRVFAEYLVRMPAA